MKTNIIILLSIALSISLFFHWLDPHDEYNLVDMSYSPDGKKVGVIIINSGGGGPGYCVDLVYIFPTPSEAFPDFSQEKRNEKFLHKQLECGIAKKLNWKSNKLVIN